MAISYENIDRQSEYWRSIPGYEGRYEISTCGRVRRLYEKGAIRIMKPIKKKVTL
jgi:hypothetical protein